MFGAKGTRSSVRRLKTRAGKGWEVSNKIMGRIIPGERAMTKGVRRGDWSQVDGRM